jgi:hypothetical protein
MIGNGVPVALAKAVAVALNSFITVNNIIK